MIEQRTSDVTSSGIRCVIAVVTAITHATNIVRRQIMNNVPDLNQLQNSLGELTERTKQAVTRLQVYNDKFVPFGLKY